PPPTLFPYTTLFRSRATAHEVHDPRVQELAREEAGQACSDDPRHKSEHRCERLLILPSGRGRRDLHDEDRETCHERQRERGEDEIGRASCRERGGAY